MPGRRCSWPGDICQIAFRIELILCGFRTIKPLPTPTRCVTVTVGPPPCGRFHSCSATRQRSLQYGAPPTPLPGDRAQPLGMMIPRWLRPSSLAAPQKPVNSRCIVKILAAIGSHGPLCLPSHASGWLLPKGGTRRDFPRTFLRAQWRETGWLLATTTYRGLRFAACRYLLPHCVAEGTWPFLLHRANSSCSQDSSTRDLTTLVTWRTVSPLVAVQSRAFLPASNVIVTCEDTCTNWKLLGKSRSLYSSAFYPSWTVHTTSNVSQNINFSSKHRNKMSKYKVSENLHTSRHVAQNDIGKL